MSELSVTEDQRRRLEAVCDDLEDAFVGAYGSVTPADALEYLIDTYTPPGNGDAGVTTAAATPGHEAGGPEFGETRTPVAVGTTDRTRRTSAGSSSDRTTDPGPPDAGSASGETADAGSEDGQDLTAIPGVGEVTAGALTEAGFDSVAAIRDADPSALTDAEGVGEKQAIDISAAVEELSTGTPGDDDDGDAAGGGPGGAADPEGGASPGSVSAEQTLKQAQSLLDAHDDRWREGGGDEPYEVDLPDGSTTGARTKDDVKRLLFKHWR